MDPLPTNFKKKKLIFYLRNYYFYIFQVLTQFDIDNCFNINQLKIKRLNFSYIIH